MRIATTKIDPEIEQQRKYIIDEIYSTEKTYVTSLKTCIDVYYTNLINQETPIIDMKDVNTLFFSFLQIHQIGEEVMKNLDELKKSGKLYTTLSSAFTKMMEIALELA